MTGHSIRRSATVAPAHSRDGLIAPLRSVPTTEDDGNWWMITLTDLTMLLLGFLVCWYVTNKPAAPAAKSAVAAEAIATKKPPVEVPAPDPLSQESWQVMQRDLRDFVAEAGLSDGVTIESGTNEIVLSLKDTVPFTSGKADLREQALPVLEKVVSIVIAQANLSVAISGHTDSLKIATARISVQLGALGVARQPCGALPRRTRRASGAHRRAGLRRSSAAPAQFRPGQSQREPPRGDSAISRRDGYQQ